ncbi:MAG: beta galactosidase jelly roll domain-containing protein [Tyzzerella sp.]|nr:beta galactosidase jelly roll domain-containing protein [Tyzzerella sp.]
MKCYIKDYPRPQFVRNQWENLNGVWDFGFDDQNIGEKERWYENFKGNLQIQVPFTFETKLSGIQDETRHDNVWYRRTIRVDESKLEDNNYVLHFEGSDFVTKLWVNGQFVGSHRGGYSRFSFDITNFVKDGENELVVKVEDSFDMQQPRGKQRWMNEVYLCWYIPTTGIWKTVWSEYVPKISLSSVKMTPNLEDCVLEVEYNVNAPESRLNGELFVEAVISYDGKLINKTFTAVTSSHVCAKLNVAAQITICYENPVWLWTPENPHLYDIEFRILDKQMVIDEVGSYFAMRDIRIDGSKVLLSNASLYQKLILDQGYWKDSHLTPPSEEALIEDIDKIKALGYNGLRKHQKVEDERFLYWCDVKGMLVWGEAPSAFQYSDYAVTEFTTEWLEIVKQNYNHPCIITWTPVNESWGVTEIQTKREQQYFTEAIYYLTKSIDKMRPVIVNDGWQHTISDIITLHDYVAEGSIFAERYADKDRIVNNEIAFNEKMLAMADGYEYIGQPIMISEFGGIAFNNDDSGWGYGGKVEGAEAFIARFDSIVTAVKELTYACGYCYTQVTDVQQEINGLMDIDRNFKIKPEIIKEINDRKVNCLVK